MPPGTKGITSAAKGEGISKMLHDFWVRFLKNKTCSPHPQMENRDTFLGMVLAKELFSYTIIESMSIKREQAGYKWELN